MQLRDYQQAAVNATYEYLRNRPGNPCVVIPTAGGKTPILATIARDAVRRWSGRVIVLSHVKELLLQSMDKLNRIAPDLWTGVYSAGLRSRDTHQDVVIAGVQSVYSRAAEINAEKPINLIIVDECHLIPADGDGMYRRFLGDMQSINPRVRVIGLTATPYRLSSGLICGSENILTEVCYEIGVVELIRDGYLCRPVSKNAMASIDVSEIHVRAGEFVESELSMAATHEGLVQRACHEILSHSTNRSSVLIFASSISHGKMIVAEFERFGAECGFITGETASRDRELLIDRFRGNDSLLFKPAPLKYLCNVNVLTTGFDAPTIDAVAVLRPTMSPGLWSQMVGRGFRIHPGKQDFLVLDFGGNIDRHGPIDLIRPPGGKSGTGCAVTRTCDACGAVMAAGYSGCPACGHVFPDRDVVKHDETASDAEILSAPPEYLEVDRVDYDIHRKGASTTMRADYHLSDLAWKSEWICFEHRGYPRQKAAHWWCERSLHPVPDSVDEAVRLARAGALCETLAIKFENQNGFDRITGWRLGPKPDPDNLVSDVSEVPF